MALLFLDLDPNTVAHLLVAVRRHRRALEQADKRCPEALIEIELQAEETVRSSQERSGAVTPIGEVHHRLHDRQWLTVEDIVTLTGLSESTVRRHIGDGSLRSSLVGRRRRVSRADLTAFMNQREEGAA